MENKKTLHDIADDANIMLSHVVRGFRHEILLKMRGFALLFGVCEYFEIHVYQRCAIVVEVKHLLDTLF